MEWLERRPYVGLAGLTEISQFKLSEQVADGLRHGRHSLMLLANVSEYTLRGKVPPAHANRFISVSTIPAIFLAEIPRWAEWGIAFSTDHPERLGRNLREIACMMQCGADLDSLQVDCLWPRVDDLNLFRSFCPDARMILRLRQESLDQTSGQPGQLVDTLTKYVAAEAITDLLIDQGNHQGELRPVMATQGVLADLAKAFPGIGIGVNIRNLPGYAEAFRQLIGDFPNLSLSSDDLCFDTGDNFQLQQAGQYLNWAENILALRGQSSIRANRA